MFCRTALAVMDANYNCDRSQKKTEEGDLKFRIKVNGFPFHDFLGIILTLPPSSFLIARICYFYLKTIVRYSKTVNLFDFLILIILYTSIFKNLLS